MHRYDGELIWIVGASSGIGAALASEFAKRGARLILTARRKDVLEAVSTTLAGEGHKVLPCDIGDETAMLSAVESLQETPPDRILHMAALYAPGEIGEFAPEDIRKIVSVNLTSVITLTQALMPVLLNKGKGGQLAFCASVAGYHGLPSGQPYSATKAAVINFAESLHAELSGSPIDIKVINPGFVRTPLTDQNDFPMPFLMAPEAAAVAIAQGLKTRRFEIHFPKRFTYGLKAFRSCPYWLRLALASRLTR